MDKFKQDVFEYLDDLRKSGVTNMLGATPYVACEFDIKHREASELLKEWMDTFEERHPTIAKMDGYF